MAEKKNPRAGASTSKNRGSAGATGAVEVDKNETDPLIESSLADFQSLFGDGSENVTVELYRTAPKYHDGQTVAGFIDNLSPGSDRAFIARNYGGGEYWIKVRNSLGHYVQNHRILIAGEPLPSPKRRSESDDSKTDRPEIAAGGGREFDGVRVGNWNQMMADLQQMMVIKSILREPDQNMELVRMLTQREKAPDLMAQASQFFEMFNKLREFLPESDGGGSGGGENIWAVIKEALKAVPKLIEARAGSGAAGFPGFTPGGSAVSAPGGLSRVDEIEGGEIKQITENTNSEGNAMDQGTMLANNAVGIIIQNFRLGKDVARTVQLLNETVPIPQANRDALLTPRKQTLFDLAETQLIDVFDNYVDEQQQKFTEYFEAVWKAFCGTD